MRDYRERLHVPLAWWLLAVPIVLILGGTLYAGLPWPWPIVIIGGLGAGCAAPLIVLGRATVEVDDGALRAGSTVLPVTAISEVVALDEKQSARLRGPRADPAAPGDGHVPYWLIGTRHPADLAAAIERCRIRAGHEPVA